MKMERMINIRPTTGVYATYKRLTYKPWTAIAEFVDNSTQSYFDHAKELKKLENFEKLHIEITYENGRNGNDVLTIRDNAYGMEIEEFERAFTLDKAPKNTTGRNEFGMGLKTAACWFGTKWSVKSSQLNSKYGYRAELDVENLHENKQDEILMDIFEEEEQFHYTEIKIENLNKRITGSRTIGKVKDFLSSIYRQDIRNGEIVISYNSEILKFNEPQIYKEKINDENEKEWKKDINFEILHNGKLLNVDGFVAIRIPGSVKEAGFTLMRRGRAIVGGPEENYRPYEIFGDSNSYAYQRLFGELNMDNWPVTQAKDQFDWHSDGLEEKFIEMLKELTKDYRNKAENIRVREKVNTEECMNNVKNNLSKTGAISDIDFNPVQKEEQSQSVERKSDKQEIKSKEVYTNLNKNDSLAIEGPEKYQINSKYNNTQYKFQVELITDRSFASWLLYEKVEENHYNIALNMKHPFFKPLIDNKEFSQLMIRLVIAIVLAEIEACKISFDGRVDTTDIRMQMNKILEELSSDGGICHE